MITVTKHGKEYEHNKMLNEIHTYKCRCGCEFTATLNDFQYRVTGHGRMDYTTICPECSRTIYDSIDRAN